MIMTPNQFSGAIAGCTPSHFMKSTSIIVALICGVSLTVSVFILSSAIETYGRSLERAAANQPRMSIDIPSSITLDLRLSDNGSPMRFEVSTKTK